VELGHAGMAGSPGMDLDEAMRAYYSRGEERDRLSSGVGYLEFLRTTEIVSRRLPSPPAVIADIGGGPGRYALWLASLGWGAQAAADQEVPEHPAGGAGSRAQRVSGPGARRRVQRVLPPPRRTARRPGGPRSRAQHRARPRGGTGTDRHRNSLHRNRHPPLSCCRPGACLPRGQAPTSGGFMPHLFNT
jgi:hypothetical protein